MYKPISHILSLAMVLALLSAPLATLRGADAVGYETGQVPGGSAPQVAATVGEGIDYATTVIGDPWDMSSITDVYNEKTTNINSSANVNRATVVNG